MKTLQAKFKRADANADVPSGCGALCQLSLYWAKSLPGSSGSGTSKRLCLLRPTLLSERPAMGSAPDGPCAPQASLGSTLELPDAPSLWLGAGV